MVKGTLKGVLGRTKYGVRGSRSIGCLVISREPDGYLRLDLWVTRLDDSGQDDKFHVLRMICHVLQLYATSGTESRQQGCGRAHLRSEFRVKRRSTTRMDVSWAYTSRQAPAMST